MDERGGHLTAEQLAELRLDLERERTRLERTMQTSRDAARPVELDQTAVGRLSRIDALQNQQLSVELHSRNEARHALIVAALERMADGSYGTCFRCRTPIPFGRLVALPEARTCTACGARGG